MKLDLKRIRAGAEKVLESHYPRTGYDLAPTILELTQALGDIKTFLISLAECEHPDEAPEAAIILLDRYFEGWNS